MGKNRRPGQSNGSARQKSNLASKPVDRWLALSGIAVGIIYSLLPSKTPTSVVVSLVLVFLLLAHPVWNFWWIERRLVRRVFGLTALGVMVGLIGKGTWPRLNKPSDEKLGQLLPKLEGRVDEVSVGVWPWDPNSSAITIIASVKNTGAPSIASDFRLLVMVPGLPQREAVPFYVPKDLVLKVRPTDPEPNRYFVTSDLLYEKALRTPIQTGALIRGFLAFRLDGIPFPVADNTETAMTLSFRDVNGKLYSGTGKIGPIRNAKLVFPGMPDSNTHNLKSVQEDPPTAKRTPTVPGGITVQAGGVASIGQQGGITAGQVTINSPSAPVSIKAFPMTANEPDVTGGGYVSKVRIVLSAPVPKLTVFASAPTLTSLAVGNGNFMLGEPGVLPDGSRFETVPLAAGEYVIILRSEQPEHFHLQYKCDGAECL